MPNKLIFISAVHTIIIFVGCSTVKQFQPVKISNAVLHFIEPLPEESHNDVVYAALAHIGEWELDSGTKTKYVKINVVSNIVYPGKDVIGIFMYPSTIEVVLGMYNNLPALYHELCHLNIAPFDYKHESPRWEEWNEIEKNINKRLILDWYDRN